jgi:hypothetical protein
MKNLEVGWQTFYSCKCMIVFISSILKFDDEEKCYYFFFLINPLDDKNAIIVI